MIETFLIITSIITLLLILRTIDKIALAGLLEIADKFKTAIPGRGGMLGPIIVEGGDSTALLAYENTITQRIFTALFPSSGFVINKLKRNYVFVVAENNINAPLSKSYTDTRLPGQHYLYATYKSPA